MKKWWMTLLATIILVPMLAVDTARASSIGEDVVSAAKELRGTPYRFGGTTTAGFDCSGYIRHVLEKFDIDMPRTARDQHSVGTSVKKSDLQPGDIVYFANTYRAGISHNGIYIGDNKFISSKSSSGVSVASLSNPYWGPRYHSAKRVIEDSKAEVETKQEIVYKQLPTGQFHDVPENHWAYSFISELSKQEIISGYKNSFFKPDEAITRVQAAIVLNRHLNLKASSSKSYKDVNSKTMGYSDIIAVSSAGIMEGFEDGNFRPNEKVSRAQIAAILDRAFEWEEGQASISSMESQFTDVSADNWSYQYIQKLTNIGVISGFEDKTYRPNLVTTRAQFSSLIYKAIND